jgi:hypothetical protein
VKRANERRGAARTVVGPVVSPRPNLTSTRHAGIQSNGPESKAVDTLVAGGQGRLYGRSGGNWRRRAVCGRSGPLSR